MSANAVIIVQLHSFCKGKFDKTYEEYVNVGSLDNAGGGVGIASLGAEEVDPFVRQFHDDFPAAGTLAVHTGNDVRRGADPDFKLVLEKAEEPETKLPTSAGSWKKQESSRKASISALLTVPKPLTVWITINCGKFFKSWEYQTT